jgi:hypothetical protein
MVMRGVVVEADGVLIAGATVLAVAGPLMGVFGGRREPDLVIECERTTVGFNRGDTGFQYVSIATSSAADGTFLVPSVPEELDRLFVSAVGYRPVQRSGTGLVRNSETPSANRVVLIRGWRVECRVEDSASGCGIPEAKVDLRDDRECWGRGDGTGGFILDCVPRGRHRLQVDAMDWVATEVPFEVGDSGQLQELVVKLDRGWAATFRVVSARGSALTGVTLDFRENSRWRPRRHDVDSLTGRVTVRGLARGEIWRVTAEADGHASSRVVVDLRSGPPPTSEVVITLQPVVQLPVRVLDAVTGLPIPHAQVNAVDEGPDLVSSASEVTDEDGNCTILGFEAGRLIRLIVTLRGELRPATMTTMRVPESESSSPVEIRVPSRNGPHEGVVCVRGPSGNPILGATVAILGQGGLMAHELTDAQGMAKFPALGSKTRGLFVTDGECKYLPYRRFLEPGAAGSEDRSVWRIDVTLEPAGSVRVREVSLPEQRGVGLQRAATLVREADGYWTTARPAPDTLDILRVAPGTYDALVLWSGHEQMMWKGPIVVKAGERTMVEGGCTRESGRSVTGRVVGGESGTYLAVEFERLPGVWDRVIVSETGDFRIDGVSSTCRELRLVHGAQREILGASLLEETDAKDPSVVFRLDEKR